MYLPNYKLAVKSDITELKKYSSNDTDYLGYNSGAFTNTDLVYFPNTTIPINARGYDIVVVCGGSNAVGEGTKDLLLDYGLNRIFQLDQNNVIIKAEEPLEHKSVVAGSMGFALKFCRKILDTLPVNRNILLIPCSEANSGFSNNKWNQGNSLYTSLISRVNTALTLSPNNRVLCFLWHGGEVDSALSQNDYINYLSTMITNIRTDLSISQNTPFVVGNLLLGDVKTKIVGSGGLSTDIQGRYVCISSDSNWIVLTGPNYDDSAPGKVWIYKRQTNGSWVEHFDLSTIRTGGGNVSFGRCAAINNDGTVVCIGSSARYVWTFTRSGDTWTEESRFTSPTTNDYTLQMSLDSVGNTLAIGTQYYNSSVGSALIYNRSASVWTLQQRLVASDSVGTSRQGFQVRLSSDGNTVAVSGYGDNSNVGATWVYTRVPLGSWSQQGSKLVGTGGVGSSLQGISLAISGDSNTLAVGGYGDNSNVGATWVFTRSGSVWSQQGSKLVGTGATGNAQQGSENGVRLSSDGNLLLVVGSTDNGNIGAVWKFTRSGSVWSQEGNKIIPVGNTGACRISCIDLSLGSGLTFICGGMSDNSNKGAGFLFDNYGRTLSEILTTSGTGVADINSLTGVNGIFNTTSLRTLSDRYITAYNSAKLNI